MEEPSRGERLQKVLARAGLGSRRACEELIAAGRVAIDGVPARLGDRVDPDQQRVTLDGTPVATRSDTVYYLLNKPTGVVSTAHDPQGRPTVVELVPREPRVFPVGRLDADTEGLLVLTNDGDFAQLLAHPRYGVDKTYLAEVVGAPSRQAVDDLRRGVELDDGPTAAAQVKVAARHGQRSALEITIHEGRNRQVRRMCEAIGHPVVRLVRTRIGPVRDAHLPPGQWRELKLSEVQALFTAAAGEPKAGSQEAGSKPAGTSTKRRRPPR